MPYFLIIIAVFAFFVWLGRETKSGRIKKGPWIKDFRVVRAVVGMMLSGAALVTLIKGQYVFAGIMGLMAIGLSQTTRFMRKPSGPITYTEAEIAAFRVLDLAVGASKKEVKEAHKRLMKTAHPDAGGTEAKAKALNAARDLLLRRR